MSIFQLLVVKLLEVLAHYVNTDKETLSPFIDSSIDNVLLQTNPGCTSPEVLILWGSKFWLPHKKEKSPVTQGLNHRSACDIVKICEAIQEIGLGRLYVALYT